MIPVPARLCLSAQAPIANESLALLPNHVLRRFSSITDLDSDLTGAVVIALPDQIESLLARPRLDCIIVVWSPKPQARASAWLGHSAVAGALDPTCSHDTVYTTIRSALLLAANQGGGRAAQMLERVLDVGRALASEKDLDTLLRLILTHARALTQADGASIYTCDTERRLSLRLWQNASVGDSTAVQSIPVGEESIAGYVFRTGDTLVLDDAYELPPNATYRFSADSDRKLGYRTQSLLTVPLKNKADETVGVLQLINRKDHVDVLLRTLHDVAHHVRAFDEQDCALVAALAGQAGVALENSILYADIERLFEGFIRASVQAIEARDPTTAGHSFRVADFTERLAIAVDRTDEYELRGIGFTRAQLQELRYASLLHDFGKVGVREDVLVKAKKLYPHQLDGVRQRFQLARTRFERRAYEQLLALHAEKLTEAEYVFRRREIEGTLAADRAQLEGYLALVLAANEPTVSHETTPQELERLLRFTFPGENGEPMPLLQEFEFANLALSKGSLNNQERVEIESHVSHTFAFLSLIPWTRELKDLPRIAYAHHEKLDGTGYPRRLTGEEIPVQSRMMAIADIYDALTARDRPYKRGLPAEQALVILQSEADRGKIDSRLLKVFVESQAWHPAPRV